MTERDLVADTPAGPLYVGDEFLYHSALRGGVSKRWLIARSAGRSWVNAVDPHTGACRSVTPDAVVRIRTGAPDRRLAAGGAR